MLLVCWASVVLFHVVYSASTLLHVTALTRHGSRAPHRILAQSVCTPLFPLTNANQSAEDIIIDQFGTVPGELTFAGETQMRQVGSFIHQRYSSDLGFDTFRQHLHQFSFTSKAGSHDQRSMMAISQGLFSTPTAVAISVKDMSEDYDLGGPPPPCGERTAKEILSWHASRGSDMVQSNYAVVQWVESMCNISLQNNPVNANTGDGFTPHAYLSEISDLMDAREENGLSFDQTRRRTAALTELAFALEQKSHFSSLESAIVFSGGFPHTLFANWEESLGPNRKRIHLFVGSREVQYGLIQLFNLSVQLPGEPCGRTRSGTTVLWELHQVGNELFVDTLLFHPPHTVLHVLPRLLLAEYRTWFEEQVIQRGGTWKEVCTPGMDFSAVFVLSGFLCAVYVVYSFCCCAGRNTHIYRPL